MNSKHILLAAVAIAITFGSYFYWKSLPEQQINKSIASFVEALEYRKVSLDNREERHELLRKVLAETVTFEGSPPVPDGEMGVETIIKRLDLLHTYTTWVEITELDRDMILKEDTAQVRLDWSIKAAAGQNYKRTENWTIVLDFEELDGNWKITHLSATTDKESAAARL